MKLKPDVKAKWLAALCSEKYVQANGLLRADRSDNPMHCCCLGVLCDISGVGRWEEMGNNDFAYAVNGDDSENTAFLPQSVSDWAGIGSTDPYVAITDVRRLFPHRRNLDDFRCQTVSLSTLNDNNFTYADIARVIEELL